MLPVPPPDPPPRARERGATRAAAHPVLPPLAARRVGEHGVATFPASAEPAVAATLEALTEASVGRARPADPGALPVSASLSLSGAARALSALAAVASPQPAIAASVRVAAPLMPHAPDAPEVPLLSASIARAVEHSGLFYEAHQAQWIAGERRLEDLMREATARTAAAHADARVAAQLALLDTGVLRVAFDAWPGQPVDLEIVDPRHRAAGEDGRAVAWRMTLELATPALGRIRATLVLQTGVLSIAVAADLTRARDEVADALPQLQRALAARNFPLTGLVVAVEHG